MFACKTSKCCHKKLTPNSPQQEELYAIEEEIQRKPPPRFDMSLRIPMTKSNTENLRRRSLPAMSTASKTPHDKTLLNLTKRGKLLGPTPISHVSRKTLAAERIKKAQQKVAETAVLLNVSINSILSAFCRAHSSLLLSK